MSYKGQRSCYQEFNINSKESMKQSVEREIGAGLTIFFDFKKDNQPINLEHLASAGAGPSGDPLEAKPIPA